MVDEQRVAERLRRLEQLLERLEEVRAAGEVSYLRDERTRAMTERWLQLAIHICIDVGAQLAAEVSVAPPKDYAGVFLALADARAIPDELGERLAKAAKQRNLLVHAYVDLDDRRVFASLAQLDDLRVFAATVQRIADDDAT